MTVPTPEELCNRFGAHMPEDLARAMGFSVQRQESAPRLPGVRVLSELRSGHVIMLYMEELRQQAQWKRVTLTRLEQWHIAHELFHHLAEINGISSWRIREGDADKWADELMELARKNHPRW